MAKLKLVTEQKRYDPEGAVRRYRRWAIYTAIGFLMTSIMLVPFFRPSPWNKYWNSGDTILLTVCLIFFIASVIEAGFTWMLCSTLRDTKRIEKLPLLRKH